MLNFCRQVWQESATKSAIEVVQVSLAIAHIPNVCIRFNITKMPLVLLCLVVQLQVRGKSKTGCKTWYSTAVHWLPPTPSGLPTPSCSRLPTAANTRLQTPPTAGLQAAVHWPSHLPLTGLQDATGSSAATLYSLEHWSRNAHWYHNSSLKCYVALTVHFHEVCIMHVHKMSIICLRVLAGFWFLHGWAGKGYERFWL